MCVMFLFDSVAGIGYCKHDILFMHFLGTISTINADTSPDSRTYGNCTDLGYGVASIDAKVYNNLVNL